MYEQIEKNKRKTFLIILFFVVFIIFLGWIFGEFTQLGPLGIVFAFFFSLFSVWGSYFYSDKIVLKISGAKPVKREDDPHLFHTVEGLSIAAGIPQPKAYVIESPALNAFATGRDPEHSAIAVTRGLLDKLNRTELEGVISHEISHIKNYDIRLATIIVTLVGVVALISDWMLRSLWWGRSGRSRRRDGGAGLIFFIIGIALAILSPLIAQLIRFSISREREFLADADGALISRYPEGLASALEKIASDENVLKTATNATAHLFISNPLKTKRKRKSNLFSTHPPIAERIEKLRSL